jgi:hypothetical protein
MYIPPERFILTAEILEVGKMRKIHIHISKLKEACQTPPNQIQTEWTLSPEKRERERRCFRTLVSMAVWQHRS